MTQSSSLEILLWDHYKLTHELVDFKAEVGFSFSWAPKLVVNLLLKVVNTYELLSSLHSSQDHLFLANSFKENTSKILEG